MHARDAHGRQVSLLNDDVAYASHAPQPQSYSGASHMAARPYPTSRSRSSTPNTPELLRSDSYDSNTSNGPNSPITPSMPYDYADSRVYAPYDDYMSKKRPAFHVSSRSSSFEDEAPATSPVSDRPGKRYPCRYRDTHGCEKTFTTSGHASRHSKIHTAEKAVQCTYGGCQKKFTRADNMKQHLETHYKDKSRALASQRPSLKTIGAVGRKHSSSASRGSSSSSIATSRDLGTWDSDQYNLATPGGQSPLPSPGFSGTWDLRGLTRPLLSRPSAARTLSSGLDALAAIACREGA